MQQTLLNEILDAAAAARRRAPPTRMPTRPRRRRPPPARTPGGSIPPSPGEYYNNGVRTISTPADCTNAIEFLIRRDQALPGLAGAARAQFTIGDAYLIDGRPRRRGARGLQRWSSRTTRIPTAARRVPEAGRRLRAARPERQRAQELRGRPCKIFPNSSAAIFALAALKRLGYHKLTGFNWQQSEQSRPLEAGHDA